MAATVSQFIEAQAFLDIIYESDSLDLRETGLVFSTLHRLIANAVEHLPGFPAKPTQDQEARKQFGGHYDPLHISLSIESIEKKCIKIKVGLRLDAKVVVRTDKRLLKKLGLIVISIIAIGSGDTNPQYNQTLISEDQLRHEIADFEELQRRTKNRIVEMKRRLDRRESDWRLSIFIDGPDLQISTEIKSGARE